MHKTLEEIVAFIGGTRRALLESARNLTPAQLRFRPAADRWSIDQLLEHVARTEARMAGFLTIEARLALERGLPARPGGPIDLSVFEELKVRVADRKFQAPREVAPEGGGSLVELTARLEAAREKVLKLVPLLEVHDMSEVRFPHPLLGDRFNLYEWLFFLGVHEARHRRQVENVKQEQGFPAG